MIKLKGLLLEYSEKVYKELISRFKSQNFNLDEENIKYYIDRFAQLLGAIRKRFSENDPEILKIIPKELHEKNKYADILQWKNFSDLEKIVDLFPAPKSIRKKQQAQNLAETDADEIFHKDGIEIYKGDSMHRCIKYGENEKYSWCISRSGETRSMYYNYRFKEGGSRMFYFVFDRNRPSNKISSSFKDKWHAFVIHVFEKGSYSVTSANNDGDVSANNWEDIGKVIPSDIWNKIKGLKSLFKYIPPSQEETELQALKGKRLTLDQFMGLSYNTKIRYIQNNAKDLPSDIFKSLDVELKNMVINFDRRCSFDELKSNLGLLKRYPDFRFTRHPDEPLPYKFIPYLKDTLQRLYYDKFKTENLTFDEVEKYFSKEILKEFIDEQIENFGFLPKEATKYFDSSQKKIFDIYSVAYEDVLFINDEIPDDITISPSRVAMVSELSYETFKDLNQEKRKKFIELLKIVGSNIKDIKKYNPSSDAGGFFTSIPTCFEYNSVLYFIMPTKKQSFNDNIFNNDEYCIADENGNLITSKFYNDIKLLSKGEPLKENNLIRRVTGKEHFWISQSEYDSLSLNGKIVNLNKILKELHFNFNDKHMLQVRARILK